MIETFRSKALADFWKTGRSSKIDARTVDRIKLRLTALNQATKPEDVDLPGFDFHALRGRKPTRYTIHVNGPWTITFEFEDGDGYRVDFEQYH